MTTGIIGTHQTMLTCIIQFLKSSKISRRSSSSHICIIETVTDSQRGIYLPPLHGYMWRHGVWFDIGCRLFFTYAPANSAGINIVLQKLRIILEFQTRRRRHRRTTVLPILIVHDWALQSSIIMTFGGKTLAHTLAILLLAVAAFAAQTEEDANGKFITKSAFCVVTACTTLHRTYWICWGRRHTHGWPAGCHGSQCQYQRSFRSPKRCSDKHAITVEEQCCPIHPRQQPW